MPRYIAINDLINYMFGTMGGTVSSIGGTITPSDQQLLSDCIDRAESAINDYTRRQFAGTAGTVYYNRFSQRLVQHQALYLQEDLHTLISLTNGDTTIIPVGSVWLEPRNAGPPYRLLRLHSPYVYVWNTDSDIIVAGTFGFGTVAPAAVQQATVRYAAWLFRQKDLGGGAGVEVAGFPDAGEVRYPKGMPDDVRYLLSPYRSRTGGAV